MNENIFTAVYDSVDRQTADFSSWMFSALGPDLRTILMSLFALYFAYWGYQLMFGASNLSSSQIIERMLRAAIIYTFVTSWPTYQLIVVDFFTKSPQYLGDLMMSHISPSANSDSGIFNALFHMVETAYDTSQILTARDGTFGFALTILGIVVVAVILIFGAVASLYILLGKIALALIIGLGPIFVVFALFPQTRGYFHKWIEQMAYWVILQVIVYALLAFILSIVQGYVDTLNSANSANTMVTADIIPVVLVAILGILILPQAQQIAANLTGAVASDVTGGGRATSGRWMRSVGRGGKAAAGAAGRQMQQQARNLADMDLTSRPGGLADVLRSNRSRTS